LRNKPALELADAQPRACGCVGDPQHAAVEKNLIRDTRDRVGPILERYNASHEEVGGNINARHEIAGICQPLLDLYSDCPKHGSRFVSAIGKVLHRHAEELKKS